MSRVINMRFTYPHPGDQHLVLCLGTLNDEWVVSTLNTTNGGHHGGHYFMDDEFAATKFFFEEIVSRCDDTVVMFRDGATWSPPDYYVDGLCPSS